ncbi:NUMOD4 motif-containing HNH endonuclease [Phenylobacterium sp. VNQ135]|uniref:NUMOD4 motif-containing HNH endonuclease n=1 Tax=Phenylobacterium sp. VNQ135 TaxID=3400922 RepID=UPI003C04E0F5
MPSAQHSIFGDEAVKSTVWSSAEVNALAELYAIGMPMEMIAKRLGRGKPAVKLRVFKLGLRRDPARFGEFPPLIALAGERWRQIEGYPSYYVSDHGRVLAMTAKVGTLLKPLPDEYGYFRVCLRTNDEGCDVQRHIHVHRLVAQHFVDGFEVGREVAHGDGVKSNCHYKNLRWATPTENAADKRIHGTHLIGDSHPNAQSAEYRRQRIPVIHRLKRCLASGMSARCAAREVGVSYTTAKNVKSGKAWRDVAA